MHDTLLKSSGSENEKQPSVEAYPLEPPVRPRKHRFILPLFFLGLAGLIGVAIYGIISRSANTENLRSEAKKASSEQSVSVIRPEKAPATITINLPGQTQAFAQAPVYAQTTGYVKSWNFDIGAHVKQGAVLAVLDTPEVDQQLSQARAQLDVAQSALHLSEATYKRNEDLFHRKVISAQDFDTAADNYHGNQATVIADNANVKRLEALEDFKVLKAPFDGIVTMRNTDLGALVNAGSGNALFTVARIQPLRVYINVPQGTSQEVKVGENAKLILTELPDQSFDGKVVRTANAIDPTSRTLLTEVDVANEDGRLLPGAYVQVNLTAGASHRSLVVPQNTLLFRSEGATVGVVGSDNKVLVKKVKIGRDLGMQLEILEGLSPEDQVILNPSDGLANGQTVRIEASEKNRSK